MATAPAPTAPTAPAPTVPEKPAAPQVPQKTPIPNRAASRFETARESMGLKKKVAAPDQPDPKKIEKPVEEKKVAAKVPKPVVPPAPAIDPAAIKAAVADGVRDGMKPVEPPKKEVAENLSPDLMRKYTVLQRMAKNHPELESKPKEFIESVKKLEAYKAEWEAKNKGEKFDIEDDQHEDFLKDNDVSWDDDLFVEAMSDIRADEKIDGVKKEFGEKFGEFENRERERNLAPALISHRATAARVLFNELGDEFKNILSETGDINAKEIASLIEKNPELEDVFPVANRVEEVSGELFRIANRLTPFVVVAPKNATKEQLKSVELHNEILSFVTGEESRMMALPEEKRKDQNGRMFATAEEFGKLSPEDRPKYWHFVDTDLSALYAFNKANEVKKMIELSKNKLEKFAKSRGYTPPESGKLASPQNGKPAPKAVPDRVIEASPAGIAAPRMAPLNNRQNGEEKPVRFKILGR